MKVNEYDHITTYTGIHFFPTAPAPEGIVIEDIAHALSLTCRGNGQVKQFFSVGQHCILCAKEARERGYSTRLVLACLLHDASESYMSDVPRPFKKYLGEYLEFEDRLLDVIYTKFLGNTLNEEEKALVKQVDDALLYYDLKYLLDEEKAGEKPVLHVPFDYNVRSFEDVEREYLNLFEQLASEMDKK